MAIIETNNFFWKMRVRITVILIVRAIYLEGCCKKAWMLGLVLLVMTISNFGQSMDQVKYGLSQQTISSLQVF